MSEDFVKYWENVGIETVETIKEKRMRERFQRALDNYMECDNDE